MVSVVDLFAGAGGMGLGMKAAGANVRLGIDFDVDSHQTLLANSDLHGGRAELLDVRSLSGMDIRDLAKLNHDDPLIIVGGPPCQPFSKAAYWLEDGSEAEYRRRRANGHEVTRPSGKRQPRPDERRNLVEEYWRLVIESRADAFVFENVRGILHKRNRPVLASLERQAESAGFATITFAVNAADYGVPQSRQRVFVIGSRHAMPEKPSPTHSNLPEAEESGLQPYKSVGPALAPFSSSKYFEQEEVVTGRWAEHLRTVPPGGNYKAHTAWGGHPNPTFVTETRYWNFLLKLHPDRTSWTINASPGPWTGPFHWESRRLRIPELAAIQSFPLEYCFEGSRREKVRQIGNAVPPKLAECVGRAILDSFGTTKSTS